MLIIKYDPDSEDAVVLPDTQIEHYIEDVINSTSNDVLGNPVYVLEPNRTIVVGSELIITFFRAALAQGKIRDDQMMFMYGRGDDEIALFPDRYGRMPYWPAGFCDHWDRALDIILSVHYGD